MSIEAMKQALEIIKNMRSGYGDDYPTEKERKTITALRQAIEEAEKQEPVAWLHPDKKVDVVVPTSLTWFDKPLPLYTAPPRKEWVGLTDEEIKNILDCGREGLIDIKKAEQILKDKNT